METSKQLTIKIQYKEDLRRFSFPRNGSFADLEKTVRNIFSFSPSYPLVLKYQDDEKDWVTCSSDSELAAAFDFVSPNGILKLLIPFEDPSDPMPPVVKSDVAPASNVNGTIVDPPASTAPVSSDPSYSCPWRERFASWKSQKDAVKKDWKEEKKRWKEQKKCKWANCTPEERAAWIQKREEWRNQCKLQKAKMQDDQKTWKCDRKMWKEQKKLWKDCQDHGVVEGCSAEGGAPCVSEQNDECRRGCPAKWRGRFVKHVTVPDGTVFAPGECFIKTWRFRNESNQPWPPGSKILFVGKNSDQMGGPNEVDVGREVAPGQEVDVSVPLTAPSQPGSYVGFWRLADATAGKRFGQRVRVQIQVQGPSSDSSSSSSEEKVEVKEVKLETPTPLPTSAPAPAPAPTPELLAQLEAMGFTNRELNMRLAQKKKGDLVKIVRRLMKLQRRELLATRR